jgi:integrase
MPERIKFSKTKISALPAPENGRSTYYDETVQKLALRITAAGTRSFYVVKRAGPDMVWLKLGTFPDMTVERAREEAEKALGDFTAESNPATIRRARRAEMIVSDFFDKEYGPRHLFKLRSGEKRSRVFDAHLRPVIGKKKLSDVYRQDVVRILSDMDANGYAGHTVNHVRNLVSGMFRHAVEWGFSLANPVTGIRGRKGVKRDRFLRGDELARFFQSLAAESNETLRDYLLLSLLTGARRTNVVEMRWRDVRLDDGVWTIPLTKNDEPQNVTLSPEALEILKGRLGCHPDFVFPGRSKRGHITEPKSGWKRILDRDELAQIRAMIESAGHRVSEYRESDSIEKQLVQARGDAESLNIEISDARLPDLRIHDLRRTLGSWQAKTGASLVIIGKSLNHKSPSATAIYARLDLDPVRQSVNTATAAMMEAGGLKKPAEIKPLKKSNSAA